MNFELQRDVYSVTITTDSGTYPFHFGHSDWTTGETTLHGPYLVSVAQHNLAGLPPFKVAGEYAWLDNNTLELVLRYIESPHSESFICHFMNNGIEVQVKRSFNTNSTDA